MSSVNKVTLLGRLGKDPEIRVTQSGDKVASLSLATSESWKDKSGTKQERTEWHRVVIFGKLAEIVEKYVGKGDQIYLEGKLVTRKWQDKDGADRWSTEVQVTQIGGSMVMLGSSNASDGRKPEAPTPTEPAGRPLSEKKPLSSDVPFDDDIPF